ncbi:MAG TPA: LppX_LprAFG lipoprotein [Ktedonobacteraceae bacterium]|nr:LppX_LprAFG lipoprotein [Ktedonobacteraceae bacterium]
MTGFLMVQWVSLRMPRRVVAQSRLRINSMEALSMHAKRFSPRRFIYAVGGTLALFLLLAGCGGNTSANAPSAQTLIKNAQAAIKKVTAYHFDLKSQNIGTGGQLPIESADGDIVVPDKLQANANVLFSNSTVQAEIIAIGNDQYINVLGGWQKTTGLLNPRSLSDPQTGVAAILGQIQNPSAPTASSSNGTPCWSINGKLNASLLSGITGGGAPAGTVDDVTVCIGQSDNLPYVIVIKGIAAQGDTAQTTRTFTLSKFNEHITINAPTVASTSTS